MELVERLLNSGFKIKYPENLGEDAPFNGLTFVFTGTLSKITRNEAQKLAKSLGAKFRAREFIKNGYYSLIVALILIAVCGCLCFNDYSLFNELQEKRIIINKLDENINKQNELLESLTKELDYYESLQDSLIEAKQTFFDNALKVDALARSGNVDFKVCYLTFDDGPYLLTDTFLDILQQKDVLATFFTRKRTDEDRYRFRPRRI